MLSDSAAKRAVKKTLLATLKKHAEHLNKARYRGLGDKLAESDNLILGPQNDLELQRLKKDIKESGDE